MKIYFCAWQDAAARGGLRVEFFDSGAAAAAKSKMLFDKDTLSKLGEIGLQRMPHHRLAVWVANEVARRLSK